MRRFLDLQRAAGNRAAATIVRSMGTPLPPLQRDATTQQRLAEVQGLPMFALLPALERLPVGVRTDEQAAGVVGGLRLVTALRAVAARRSAWEDFRAAHGAELNALPVDQIENISAYLNARDIGSLRSAMQAIPADRIRADWPARKHDFIAVASDPSNSLNAAQVYQIWLHYWVDEQATARREYRVLDDALRSADVQAYVEKRPKFDAGVRGLYPPEYEAAADRLAAADYYSSYLVGVHDWLESYVDVMRGHVTLEQVNLKTVELIKAKNLRMAILGIVIAIASVPAPRGVAPKGGEPEGGATPSGAFAEGAAVGARRVFGGGGPDADVMTLYRYCKDPGTVRPGGWWTTRPAANRADAARITGVPENEANYEQRVLVNASTSKHAPYFMQGGTRAVGDSLIEEFRNVSEILSEDIEVAPVRQK